MAADAGFDALLTLYCPTGVSDPDEVADGRLAAHWHPDQTPPCPDLPSAANRITSYNVCYTKLLRGMTETKERLRDLHFPALYVLGGETDIAYENGMDDYLKIDHVPVAVASIDKGHGGTYAEPNGGAAAAVVVDWLQWQLRGSRDAARTFVGEHCGLCTDSQWQYMSRGFD